MNSKLRGMILGSFVADALALGPHWIYDTDQIDDAFGDIKGITAPPAGSYHKGKVKGDFTHYGDQMLMLLKHLRDQDGFDSNAFKDAWTKFMETYEGYKDHATKDSMHLYQSGNELGGSKSDELGGVARMTPIIYLLAGRGEDFTAAAIEQTKMTHTGGDVLDMAKAIAMILDKVLSGTTPKAAISQVGNEIGGQINKYIEEAIAHEVVEPREMISVFGQSCSGKSAFPSVMYLINKFEDDLEEALIENVSAGGDSAARGMVIGMILGAHLGADALPQAWLKDMNSYNEILELL